MPHLVK